jgi:hypothetical protein
MSERGPDGRFGEGNRAAAGRSQPILPADWTPPAVDAPARGYSWPPFEPGNEAHRSHGALTARITAPLVRELVGELLALAQLPDSPVSYLRDPSYLPEIEGWALAQVQERLVATWLEEHGVIGEDGQPRAAVEVRRRLGEQAAGARSRLGLNPVSRAKLVGQLASATRDVAAAAAHAELQELYGRPVVVGSEGDGS